MKKNEVKRSFFICIAAMLVFLFALNYNYNTYVYAQDSDNTEIGLPYLCSLNVEGADFYTPYNISSGEYYLVMRNRVNECSIIFTVSDNTKSIILQDKKNNVIDAIVKVGNKYQINIKASDFNNNDTNLNYSLVLESEAGNNQSISFNISKRNSDLDLPDKITGYLCVGSQYSDGGNRLTGTYGLKPEKSLIGLGYWWSPISLGNFGGYITYYYEDPIKNNPNNPYGIDFIVYGNSNGGPGFSEPGNVLVSENGENWYLLAGSEHYENRTRWNYKALYKKYEKDTDVNNIKLDYSYPSKDSYPLHDWTEDEDNIIIEGTAIGNGISADYPSFGYADVHTNSILSWGTGEKAILTGIAKNPYSEIAYKEGLRLPENIENYYEGAGDGFDLEWAVDENGLPVKLSQIHYIKVYTASPVTLITGSLGEKSTEVNTVTRAVAADTNIGVSLQTKKIKIGENELILEKGNYCYETEVNGIFDVIVDADEDTNVYINNHRGNSRRFLVSPNKNIIRIIVQQGNKSPVIYYVKVKHNPISKEYIRDQFKDYNNNQPVVRKDFIDALYSLCGKPEILTNIKGKYNSKDIQWAFESKLIEGYKRNLLLEKNITREELSKVLYFLGNKECFGQIIKTNVDKYPDYEEVDKWAQNYMIWSIGSEILPEKDNILDPKGYVTYTEMTDILYKIFSGQK